MGHADIISAQLVVVPAPVYNVVAVSRDRAGLQRHSHLPRPTRP